MFTRSIHDESATSELCDVMFSRCDLEYIVYSRNTNRRSKANAIQPFPKCNDPIRIQKC